MKGRLSSKDEKVKTLGTTWTFKEDGCAVMVALYVDLADPTFVTYLPKVTFLDLEPAVDRAKDGRLRLKTDCLFVDVQVLLLSPVIFCSCFVV